MVGRGAGGTIYGAFLQYSGAGRFFLDFSFSLLGGKTSSAGRSVVLASFLLGAILSPPVLGAAAFLIAEYLRISYLDVIKMATIPTLLYYFSLFLMVELDARKYGMNQAAFEKVESAWALALRYWYYFLSLTSIVIFMLIGFSPTVSVFWATVTAFVVSFFRREGRMGPKRFVQAMEAGTTGAISVAATCASAGIIVGVVTLTGLGLKFSSIVIAYAGGSLPLTALYTALIVWIVGLAVPVTASYIICAVIAAHMFIFYYALLSEVSPPTALSCFAAAAITGADPYKTTLQAWKYTMPAFVVPFFFVLDPLGTGLLLKLPTGATWAQVSMVIALSFVAIAALAAGLQGYIVRKLNVFERVLLIGGGLLLVTPIVRVGFGGWVVPVHADWVGIGVIVAALVVHMARVRVRVAAT